MDTTLRSYLRALGQLSAESIRSSAVAIRHAGGEAGEGTWWEATVAIDRALRGRRRAVHAAAAGRRAAETVLAAGVRNGLSPADPDVVTVARRAAQVARGLVAGPSVGDETLWLLESWQAGLPFQPPVAGRRNGESRRPGQRRRDNADRS